MDADSGSDPDWLVERKKQRSFAWVPEPGDSCNDCQQCVNWREFEEDEFGQLVVREWHSDRCWERSKWEELPWIDSAEPV